MTYQARGPAEEGRDLIAGLEEVFFHRIIVEMSGTLLPLAVLLVRMAEDDPHLEPTVAVLLKLQELLVEQDVRLLRVAIDQADLGRVVLVFDDGMDELVVSCEASERAKPTDERVMPDPPATRLSLLNLCFWPSIEKVDRST